ncbi:Rhodanese-like domain-containing protein [Pyronema omphalodes]|nr:Rhodanese-like domain-containing protein [Pyronema omphalodes]
MASATEASWHAAFPKPQAQAEFISREETLALFSSAKPGKDFILVDVRRTDFEGGTIKHSVNFPAHSFYHIREAVYDLVKAAGVKTVISYCGSSNGRGPRVAGWLQDVINEKGDNSIKSVAMTGGIKGWAKAGEEYTSQMIGYEKEAWETKPDGCA